jgi:hypothetical protein
MTIMSLPAFLTVLALGLVSAFVFHVLVRYRILDGVDGFMGMWILGFSGGWLGRRVFGHWGLPVGGLYFIPAILGAFAAPFLVAMFKALATTAITSPRLATATTPVVPAHVEMRKAS